MTLGDRIATPDRCHFIPPYLMEALAKALPGAADSCHEQLRRDQEFRASRETAGAAPMPGAGVTGDFAWTVYDAQQTTNLPGTPVRTAGQPEVQDAAVDEAAFGGQTALDLFAQVYGRDSYDGAGAPVLMTVHYGRNYSNAFWNGSQLVFGDGDGQIFERFTKPMDVLTHELTHAVTEYSAGLVYRGQPGALNESLSDVFAACAKQRSLGQSAADADWLIGAGIFTPGVNGRALRDMAAPGTAYDDPRVGRDPQVGHMDDFIVTTEDNGGVHLNSGIPNRAFYLAATMIGGNSWDGAGAIWYAALTSGDLRPSARFADFAAATITAAGDHAAVVTSAWEAVGVSLTAAEPAPAQPRPTGSTAVEVVRSGGLLGQTVSGSVDVETDDPRVTEVKELVDRIDVTALPKPSPSPDMYVYVFFIFDYDPIEVPEQQLTDELQRLAQLVLWVNGEV